MYVRWNRKKQSGKTEPGMNGGDYIYAVLVEAHRIDGKPRQKTIKYLGGIGGHDPDVYACMVFWDKAEKELAFLNLDPETREKVVVSLEKVVPKPPEQNKQGEGRLNQPDKRA